MKNILGIDCCSRWTNIGIVREGMPVGEINHDLGRDQASLLPGLVSFLLKQFRMDLQDLDVISVTVGPGYFTGIRVGIAYAISLAEGLGIEVAPVSSLEATAFAHLVPYMISIPVIWDKKGQVYAAGYRMCGDTLITEFQPGEYTPDYLYKLSKEKEFPSLCLTPDLTRLFEPLSMVGFREIRHEVTRGSSVALLGLRGHTNQCDPSLVRAQYLRGPDIGP